MEHEIGPAHPPIAPREVWLEARLELLEAEKALTREYDRINAMRRRLPMVRTEKAYTFQTPDGEKSLADLFAGRLQLIVYHFMFDPEWDKGCPGCTGYVDAIADLSTLADRNTSMVLVSRAPLDKLLAYREARGWSLPWVSSQHSDFNLDFGVTLDPASGHVTYNYKSEEESSRLIGPLAKPSEFPGLSVFFRLGTEVFHTYSTFGRGGEHLTDSYRLLDVTPYGRQEDFEDSPDGWPQRPTYG